MPKLEEDNVLAYALLEGVVISIIMIGINPATSNNNTDIATTGEAILGINTIISKHVFN